tara:strand:- start:855 stop:1703 length:849 start_codon:yes stop_codon:yes gene_type:complete
MIIWIASYPKSGNTWLRSLVSAYYFSRDGSFDQDNLKLIDQFPSKKYLKDYDYNKKNIGDASRYWIKAQKKINSEKKIRFFKTHSFLGSFNNNEFTNNENTLGAIYIIRDPRNVITSLKNHFDMNYDEALNFIKSERKFLYDYNKKEDYSDFQIISSWEKNHQSWKNNKTFPIKFVKYEDLSKKTFEVFKDIIEFINYISGNKKIFDRTRAIKSLNSTSFEKLKKLEKKEGFDESILSSKDNNKIPFFYLGPKNDWKKILKKEIQDDLEKNFQESLKDLDYL